METGKVYLRPSAQPLLQAAPTQVAILLAQYLKLIQAFAQKHQVRVSRTVVSGYRDEEDGSQQLAITHRVSLGPVDTMAYRSHLGTEIEEWVRELSPDDVDLVHDWFILEVSADPDSFSQGN